jgi:hypothetical protein
MDKRYQVFVSSTFEDLIEERQEIMQALLELDCIPSGMELFPAADEDQWTLIKRVIEDCDYYIVIIGGRYGSIGPSGKSYTQMEYEYALEIGKPIIAFLHKNPEDLPAKKTDIKKDKLEKLDLFKKLVSQKMIKYWSTPYELGSVVSRSIIKLIKNNPAIGWVRGDLLPDKSSTEEILSLRKEVEKLEKELKEIKNKEPEGIEDLSKNKDQIKVRYNFTAYKDSYLDSTKYQSNIKVSWDNIFARISPLLIDETTEKRMKYELGKYIKDLTYDDLVINKELKNYSSLQDFSINEEDFNTIKVQLLALKLIVKSDRNRSVKDKSTYWTLTPYGENKMLNLRAIHNQKDKKEDISTPINDLEKINN